MNLLLNLQSDCYLIKEMATKKVLVLSALMVISASIFIYLYRNQTPQQIISSQVSKESFLIENGNLYQKNNGKNILLVGNNEIVDIDNFYVGPNNKYLLLTSFVKERGAGKEYDMWLFDLMSKKKINISKAIKSDDNFKRKYEERDIASLFLTLKYYKWNEKNPIFQVADGWSMLEGDWEYDVSANKFSIR